MIELKYKDPHDFAGGEDAVKLPDNEVQRLIDSVLKGLSSEEPGGFSLSATGDTLVIGTKYEDEQNVYVCRNYDEAVIYKEDGEWEKVDWLYEEEPEEEDLDINEMLKDFSRDDLIDLLKRIVSGDRN